MSCTLTLKNLGCDAGGKTLFRGISINLTHKDKIAVIGPNGSGKTTLLKTMVGLLKPAEGSIEVFHKPLLNEKDFTEARTHIGYLFQDSDDQIIAPTVLEEVAFGLLNNGTSKKDAIATADAMLDSLGILHLRERITLKLSGGEKKLAALASVLVMEPSILLLDEPSSALDTDAENRIAEILCELDKSMLIVSHNMEFIEKTGAKKMFLHKDGLSDFV
jgi:cobalt/nickel transport system ATP-binding protein